MDNNKTSNTDAQLLMTSVSKTFPLGTAEPPGWNPLRIRYYKLSYNVQPGAGLIFEFSDGGIYLETARPRIDIQAFISALVSNTLPAKECDVQRDIAPHVRFNYPCYFVFQLDDSLPNWRFRMGDSAIMTGKDQTDKYFLLNYVNGNGRSTTTPPGTDDVCRLVYFGADKPLVTGAAGDPNDPFNLYIELDQGFPGLLSVILDPDIKNHGNDPDNNG